MNAQEIRQRYLADKVNTATPAQLIVMLYDRLSIDVERAAAAQADNDPAAASAPLLHAQQVVAELHASLDTSSWDGGEGLASLYQYLLLELIAIRRTPDSTRLRAVARIVGDLRSAWSEAALLIANLDEPVHDRPVVAGAWIG
jgi:flagellar secretion chaperone FliS